MRLRLSARALASSRAFTQFACAARNSRFILAFHACHFRSANERCSSWQAFGKLMRHIAQLHVGLARM